MLVTNPVNVRYLSGFTGGDSFLLLYRSSGKTVCPVIISDPRFTIQITEEAPGYEAVIRPPGQEMSEAILKCLGTKSRGKMAVEAETLAIAARDRIATKLPNWELVPTCAIVEELRQIKCADEIKLIRHAIDVAYQAFVAVREIDFPQSPCPSSWSEIGIRNQLEHWMRLRGAEEKSFPSIIAAGPRAALPHAVPTKQTLENQSHLLFDWGAVVDGYMSDLTRVLILSPTKKLRAIYETVLKAQTEAIKAIKPGKTGEEIDAVARGIIKDAGFGKYFQHGLGHSLGLEIHENPRFRIGSKAVIKPGMVMTVEPGIYIKDWGGVRIEDDILVTKTGCDVLSKHVPKLFDEMVQ